MPLDVYGVLKARAKVRRLAGEGQSHYQLHVEAGGIDYRVAINVRSKLHPSPVAYLFVHDFVHPLTCGLSELPPGFHRLDGTRPQRLALDYIRLNLFEPDEFLVLPCEGPGCRADLNAVLDEMLLDTLGNDDARVYTFGEPWEAPGTSDPVFRFRPARGMHEVHMNQGNDPSHWEQDGVWQDGGLLVEHRAAGRWLGLFLKFQSQSWHTDDASGHALAPPKSFNAEQPVPLDRHGKPHPDGMVRIIAASLDPLTVTLLNVCPFPVDVARWSLANRALFKWKLQGVLAAGESRVFPVGRSLEFDAEGGLLTLFNQHDLKVHGVSYTAEALKTGKLVFCGADASCAT
ncbi:MAG TPA: YukJ family protein [Chthoniobacteraceae bacterium]|nr:YukJ family protein [Chthoniobacteraceae bacterium]